MAAPEAIRDGGGLRLMTSVASEAAAQRDELVDAIIVRLRSATPALFATPSLEQALRHSAAANLERLHQFLLLPDLAPSDTELPTATHELTATSIRHSVSLVELLEAWRVGQAFVSDWWRHRIEEQSHERESLIDAVGATQDRISAYVDTATAQIRTSYEISRRAWGGTATSRRARMVHRLLDGEHEEIQHASAVLGYPIDASHTGGILWTPQPSPEVPIDRALAAMSPIPTAHSFLAIPMSSTAAWVWSAEPGRGVWHPPTGWALALGSRLRGVRGFTRTHREALEAQRVAMAGQTPQVVNYVDVEVVAVMSRDPEAMWALVRRSLGGLTDTDVATAVLRDTLAAYLACGFSATATSRALHTHRNTVMYRMRRIAEVIGADFADRALDLAVALRVVSLLGLPPATGSN